jgi:hypothetical protein
MVETQRKTGLTDEVQIQDGTGTDVFSDVEVNIASASHDVEIPSDLLSSVGEGAGFVSRQDGVVNVSGDISIRAIDLSVLRLIGDYTEDTDAGTWTVSSTDTLPEWEFHQKVTDNEAIVLSGYDDSGAEPEPAPGFKFDSATFTVSKDETVTVDFSGMGLYAELQSTSIDTNNSVLNPENWLDAHVEIDGAEVGTLEDVEVDIARDADAVRGIEQRKENYRLLPSEIIEGMRDVSFSMTIEINDKTAWEQVMDDQSGTPVRPSDERTEKTVKVVTDGAGDLTVNGAIFENVSGELSDDAEVRTVDVDGNARDWVAEGDL